MNIIKLIFYVRQIMLRTDVIVNNRDVKGKIYVLSEHCVMYNCKVGHVFVKVSLYDLNYFETLVDLEDRFRPIIVEVAMFPIAVKDV